VQQQRKLLREAAQALKAPVEELGERIAQLQAQLKDAKKAGAKAQGGDVAASFEKLKASLEAVGDVLVGVFDCPDLGSEGIKEVSDRLKSAGPRVALALFGRESDRVPFRVLLHGLADRKAALNAGNLAKLASKHLGGGGGGRPDDAQGQGLKPEGVPAAVRELRDALVVGSQGA